MKYILFLILICTFTRANAVVGVGYSSNKVTIWRYWEIGNDNIARPKILVYNISDTAVSFVLKKMSSHDTMNVSERKYLREVAKMDNDTIVKPVMIPAHEYRIYDLMTFTSSLYDAAFINGKRIGIMSDLQKLKLERYQYMYYSYEGLMGTSTCLTGKNRLFIGQWETDTMLLDFDCSYKPYNEKGRQVSATVNVGIKKMTLCYGNNCLIPNTNTMKTDELEVNIENKSAFSFTLIYATGKVSEMPAIDVYEAIHQYGFSMGSRLPVLVK